MNKIKNQISLFDILNNLTLQKIEFDRKDDALNKAYSQYMINRFVSMTEIFVPIVNEINQYDVPKDVHYNYYLKCLPKRKQYFRYIKKKNELHPDDLQKLCQYFKCGERDLKYFLQVLTKEQIKEIVNLYRTS